MGGACQNSSAERGDAAARPRAGGAVGRLTTTGAVTSTGITPYAVGQWTGQGFGAGGSASAFLLSQPLPNSERATEGSEGR